MSAMLDPPAVAPLDIAVTANHERVWITLAGEIDITNADRVRGQADRCLNEPEVVDVVVDLEAVTFIDSSGLHALLFSRRRADELGKTFRIRNHHGHVARVIDLVGLTRCLTEPT